MLILQEISPTKQMISDMVNSNALILVKRPIDRQANPNGAKKN